MSLNSRNHILRDIALLLAQGGDRVVDSFGEAAALVALIAKAAFVPQHRAPQSFFAPIVGWFHPWHQGKAMLTQAVFSP